MRTQPARLTNVKSNFICSIGRGTNENLFPRSPRLSFEEANRIVQPEPF
jgi:3-hydroxypropanoate dehydrogenase